MKKIIRLFALLYLLTIAQGAAAQSGTSMSDAINVGAFSPSRTTYTDAHDISTGYHNNIGHPSPDIWYKFSIASSATVTITTCGSNFDTFLHLLDQNGNEVDYDDDGGCEVGTSALSLYGLSAGTYYAVGEGYAYNTGYLQINMSFHDMTANPVCDLIAASPGNDQNYIITYTPLKELTNIGNSNGICETMADISYLDGLGRPSQTVQVKASPGEQDVVLPIVYDQYGRESYKYQPYAAQPAYGAYNDGSFKPNAISNDQSYYNGPPSGSGITATGFPFSQTVFESSPLNRPEQQGAPGNDWQPSGTPNTTTTAGHTAGMTYAANGDQNDALRKVKLWRWNSGSGAYWNNTYYNAGTLYLTTTTDENSHWTAEYKDLQGHVVCKKVQGPNGTVVETNYIYDDFGQLAYVVPPVPDNIYPQSFSEADAVFNNFIYGYHYDERNRVIEKKIPGKGWEFTVYNLLDQPIYTQNGEQRNRQEVSFSKYDAQGRVVMTGIESGHNPAAESRQQLQDFVTNVLSTGAYGITGWETTDPNSATGYTNTTFPNGPGVTPLTISYYDEYTFPGNPYGPWNGLLSKSTGLLTASRTAVLNADGSYGPLLWAVNYYDNKGRIIQTSKQHYLGGAYNIGNYGVVLTTYNFNNSIATTTRFHYANYNQALQVDNAYFYDHRGRRTQNYEAVNGAPSVLLSEISYNDIGQVKNKSLGNSQQTVRYTYNERGWLTHSISGYFDLQLRYNQPQRGAVAQWNGNIAEQEYNKQYSGNQWVTYGYDELNRLNNGISSQGLSETGISYDSMGNIISLKRGESLYSYNYDYSNYGNKLQSVPGMTGNYVYDQNGNVGHDGRNNTDVSYNLLNLPRGLPSPGISYVYDASGNKLSRTYNGATTYYVDGIQYTDNHLDFVQTEEGRVINLSATPNYEFTLTDHLGNNRVTFDQTNGLVGEEDYYPFGLNASFHINAGNEYLYNKKELQDGLGQYDYGARFYDPVIARWTTPDPLAEISRRWTPYGYGENNPIRNIDVDGMWTETSAGYTSDFPEEAQAFIRGLQLQQGSDDNIKKQQTAQPKTNGIWGPWATDSGIPVFSAAARSGNQLSDGKYLQSVISFGESLFDLFMWERAVKFKIPSWSSVGPELTSGQMGKIIGWGEGQTVEAAEKTNAITNNLTSKTVEDWTKRGLTKEWVTKQLSFYNDAVTAGGKKMDNNMNLLPRKALMEKVLKLWK